ncbi:hypothetical protein PLICRDRAFT_159996 [Plicaturopsis crispa FD-325 SS-3]|nr:hypothetical protein PLICRDRAFT_159996 [Plicaturopsis crispa FD-325 SS-3]
MSEAQNHTSAGYKKARKQHLKSTKNRNPEVEVAWTPFRAAEKRYKARFPPPDLSDVLDLATLDHSRADETCQAGWTGRSAAVQHREIMQKNKASDEGGLQDKKAYVVPRIPGLVILPAFVPLDQQKQLVRWSIRDHARHPNKTNLDIHYALPPEGLWDTIMETKLTGQETVIQPLASTSTSTVPASPAPTGPRTLISNAPASPSNFHELKTVPKPPPPPSPSARPAPARALLRKLRWANIGWFYHWGTKQYDFSKGKQAVDPLVRNLCRRAVESVNWGDVFGDGTDTDGWGDDPDWRKWDQTYEPDAGIVNFYQTNDTLMAHVDRSEVCHTSPLVSVSLGNAAIFLIGGLTRDEAPTPILLRSGDVVIMSGPACRRAYHGVPRILEGTLPLHLSAGDLDWEPYAEYLKTTRININVRQVFPKDFDPGLEPTP